MDRNADHKQFKAGFANGEYQRESFFGLHQRQKETFATQADRTDKFESTAAITINSLVRLGVFVKLLDINLGPYIGFARQRARTAYLTGTRNWHLHKIIDVAEIDIKLAGRTVFIQIMPADSFYFEFASSGKPVITEVATQDGVGFPTYKGCMVGVNVAINNNVLTARPTLLQGKRDIHGQFLSVVKRPYQVQLTNEPVSYPRAVSKFGRIRTLKTVFDAYAPIHPWTGILLRDTDGPLGTYQSTVVCGPGSTFSTRDFYYDVPYGEGYRKDPVKLAYIRGTMDWPRASGNQIAKHPVYGEREFAIYVDAFNQFAVFPVSAIGPVTGPSGIDQNVPATHVQIVTPVFPSWVYVPTSKASTYWAGNPNVKEWCIDEPEFDWRFNHTGTKCAVIAFERIPFAYDSTFWSTNINPGCPFNATKFATLSSWMGSDTNYIEGFAPDTYNNTRYFSAPGVIEFEVKITLTGPDSRDFTVELVPTVIRRPLQQTGFDSRWALFIDYVYTDMPKRTNTNALVKAGTLVSLDLEYWVRPNGNIGQTSERQTLLSVRNLYEADYGKSEIFSAIGAPILAVDLKVLAMVLRLDAYTTTRKFSGDGTILNFPVHHFGAWIIHSGISKEVVFPSTMPDYAKEKLNGYAVMNGRQLFGDKITASGGGWEYVPVNTPKDAWADTSVNNLRTWWAAQLWFATAYFFAVIDPDNGGGYVKYKTGAPAYPADGDATQKWLNAVGGDWVNIFFCDSPRFGVQQYASITTKYMAVSCESTFFAHPNGTYAFWANDWIYDLNGLPGDYVNAVGPGATSEVGQGTGSDWSHNTLAVYDPTLVEHVVFDRVHFEIKIKDNKTRTRKTSFMELYNKALIASADKIADSENLQPITLQDMQGTFTKEIGYDTNGYEFLDLKITWEGTDWWYRESAWMRDISNGFPPLVGTAGNFNNLNLQCYWRTTNFAGGGIAYPPGANRNQSYNNWHVRFANTLLIMTR